MRAERQPYLLLAAVIILWGANWPIMKVGLEYIPPIWFASTRLLLGSACLFALLAARRAVVLPDRRDFPILLSVSLMQLGIGTALMHIGLTVVEAGRSAILTYTTPLWVTPLAVFFLHEKIGPAKAWGLALGLAGVFVLFNPLEFDFTDTDLLAGNGYLIGSAMAMAFVIIHIRRHRMVMTPLQIMPWQTLIGGVILAMTAYFLEGVPVLDFSPSFVAILAYNGLIASGFCFWAYQTVMRELPATSTSLGSLGIPVAGMVFSAIALGEELSFSNIAGLTLISSGVAFLFVGDYFWNRNNNFKG
jgi:drug/metabolite transporter (DMT)-like permease